MAEVAKTHLFQQPLPGLQKEIRQVMVTVADLAAATTPGEHIHFEGFSSIDAVIDYHIEGNPTLTAAGTEPTFVLNSESTANAKGSSDGNLAITVPVLEAANSEYVITVIGTLTT